MASSCSRFISRATVSALKSSSRSASKPASAPRAAGFASSPNKAGSSPLPRFGLSRTPSELGCVQSLLPLHSAVAAARMTSCLSTSPLSCRALSQVVECCFCILLYLSMRSLGLLGIQVCTSHLPYPAFRAARCCRCCHHPKSLVNQFPGDCKQMCKKLLPSHGRGSWM